MGLARVFVTLGILFLAIGGFFFLFSRLGIEPGRLPGDFRWQSGSLTCMVPLATSILLSIILTVLLNLVTRLWK